MGKPFVQSLRFPKSMFRAVEISDAHWAVAKRYGIYMEPIRVGKAIVPALPLEGQFVIVAFAVPEAQAGAKIAVQLIPFQFVARAISHKHTLNDIGAVPLYLESTEGGLCEISETSAPAELRNMDYGLCFGLNPVAIS